MSRPENTTSLWFETALLPQGWADRVRITLSDGVIRNVTRGADPDPLDERHTIGIPGAGNVHSHAFQRAIAGLTEHRRGSDSFWSWRESMYAFVQKVTADELAAIAAQAYVEMLEAGITRVAEFHYLHHAPNGEHYSDIAEHALRLVEAATATGMGLTLLPVFYAHGGVGGQPARPSQSRFVNSLDSYERLLTASTRAVSTAPFASIGIAAHSLRAVTPAELDALVALAARRPIHIHIAEQLDEVEQWQQWAGCRPVEWLLDHAQIDERWCLVHATHVTEQELDRVANSSATVGLCPTTEANLGDGLFPAREFLRRGGQFGIGTDSNIRIDFAEELRLLEYGQRLIHRERNVLHESEQRSTGRTLYEKSLAGARSTLAQPIGELREGCIADIVSLSNAVPSMRNRTGDTLLDSWIFTNADAVDCVWTAGAKVVRAGRHDRRDEIAQHYALALERLMRA